MKKELVVSGCSYIGDYVREQNEYLVKDKKHDIHFVIDGKIYSEKWNYIEPFALLDYHLGEYLDLKPVNLGTSGSSNKQIFETSVDYIGKNHNKIKLFIVSWTCFKRMGFMNDYRPKSYETVFYNYGPINQEDVNCDKPLLNNGSFTKQLFDLGFIDVKFDVDYFYRCSYLLEKLCESYDIRLVQGFSFRSTTHPILLEHPYVSRINLDNFYGFPGDLLIGGTPLFSRDQEYTLTKNNLHPNELGHKKTAENLINFIEERNIL